MFDSVQDPVAYSNDNEAVADIADHQSEKDWKRQREYQRGIELALQRQRVEPDERLEESQSFRVFKKSGRLFAAFNLEQSCRGRISPEYFLEWSEFVFWNPTLQYESVVREAEVVDYFELSCLDCESAPQP